jgi:acylphosphatase
MGRIAKTTRGENATMAEMVARMVYYSGTVQGVGFRATTAHLARTYPVTGWVRNLPDGRVQLLVEGPAERVEAFLLAVRSYWRDYLKGEQQEEKPVSGGLTRFTIAG